MALGNPRVDVTVAVFDAQDEGGQPHTVVAFVEMEISAAGTPKERRTVTKWGHYAHVPSPLTGRPNRCQVRIVGRGVMEIHDLNFNRTIRVTSNHPLADKRENWPPAQQAGEPMGE